MAVAHLIDFAGEVEGIHDLFARSVGVIIDDAHHGPGPFVKRAMRAIRLKFVVLDEVDAGFAQRLDESAVSSGREPTLGLMMVPISGRSPTPARSPGP